jgi:archaetidylinositol phosphate synthase
MPEIKKHTRVNDILLGPLERPVLLWLAKRMPAWVTPDQLTGLGLFASILIFVGYWATNLDKSFLWLASFGFVLNWFGDSLDGNLARYRKIERPRYGYFIDHTVDAASVVLVFMGIALSPFVDFKLASLTLISYLLMSIMVYITTYVDSVFRVSYARLGPTEMRLLAILANTVVYFVGNPSARLPIGTFTFYDLIALIVAVALFSAFIYMTVTQGMALSKADRTAGDHEPAVVLRRTAKTRKERRRVKTRRVKGEAQKAVGMSPAGKSKPAQH